MISYVTFLTHCQGSKSGKNREKLRINLYVPVGQFFILTVHCITGFEFSYQWLKVIHIFFVHGNKFSVYSSDYNL